jgi:hypothetical protein
VDLTPVAIVAIRLHWLKMSRNQFISVLFSSKNRAITRIDRRKSYFCSSGIFVERIDGLQPSLGSASPSNLELILSLAALAASSLI